jgi:hypothetical protein
MCSPAGRADIVGGRRHPTSRGVPERWRSFIVMAHVLEEEHAHGGRDWHLVQLGSVVQGRTSHFRDGPSGPVSPGAWRRAKDAVFTRLSPLATAGHVALFCPVPHQSGDGVKLCFTVRHRRVHELGWHSIQGVQPMKLPPNQGKSPRTCRSAVDTPGPRSYNPAPLISGPSTRKSARLRKNSSRPPPLQGWAASCSSRDQTVFPQGIN